MERAHFISEDMVVRTIRGCYLRSCQSLNDILKMLIIFAASHTLLLLLRNALFPWKGQWHMMWQSNGGWGHAVSPDLARWTLTNKYSIKSIDIVLSNRFHPLINRLRCTIVLYALVALLILLTAGAHSIASLFLSFPLPLPLFLPLPPRNARLSRHKGNILPSPVQMRGMVR